MKIGHVEIKVQQYADGRWGFDDYSQGPRRMVRLWKKEKAEARASDIAVLLANGRPDLLGITREEIAEVRRLRDARNSGRPLSGLCWEFLQIKHGKSSRHVQSLERDLKLFEQFIQPATPIAAITALQIQSFLDSRTGASERRKLNLRSSIVSLFRWATRMSYLPRGEGITEAEKVERIVAVPGQANVLTADQMRTLIVNVQDQFLPWLLIGGFAGIRSEEIAPDPKSKKSPLRWEDFHWRDGVIIVRAETAKTKEAREVPIQTNLAQWLAPYKSAEGPVLGSAEQPSKREATRIGKFIGGWKHNALRDSYCSYRARITQNVPKVSYEMGNSIAMVKRSYHRQQSLREARKWFNIKPAKFAKNVVPFYGAKNRVG
jgi:integrase